MGQLVRTTDGSVHYMSARGLVTPRSNRPEPTAADPALVQLELPKMPKPVKKGPKKYYKFHKTKPWTGTYGKFLELFGNGLIRHSPAEKYSVANNYGIDLGNVIVKYSGEPHGNEFVATYVTDGELFLAHRAFKGLLAPEGGSNPHIKEHFANVVAQLEQKIHEGVSVPLTAWDPLPAKPEPESEPDVKKRECADPGCAWCHPTVAAAKVARCAFCRNYHPTIECPLFSKELVLRESDLLKENNWTHPFCTRCGSHQHADEDCEEVELICDYCGNVGHAQPDCPKLVAGGSAGQGTTTKTEWEKTFAPTLVLIARKWAAKGKLDKEFRVSDLWPIHNDEIDPVTENANFVVLDFVSHNLRLNRDDAAKVVDPFGNLDLRYIVDEANQRFKLQMATIDPAFREYVDMACGGELRHHRAIGGRVLPGPASRPAAWKAWKEVRKVIGPKALVYAQKLFKEYQNSGYGGPKWAEGCKLLYMRETGVISPYVFCDRVFDLEHNGGAFLNKVTWNSKHPGYDLHAIKRWIGPARKLEDIDWSVILWFADRDIVELFNAYWLETNRMARTFNITPGPVPTKRKTTRDGLMAGYPVGKKLLGPSGWKTMFPNWGGPGSGTCGSCGKLSSGYQYYCEDAQCTSQNIGSTVGTSHVKFCEEHMTKCARCHTLLCENHGPAKHCTACAQYLAAQDGNSTHITTTATW